MMEEVYFHIRPAMPDAEALLAQEPERLAGVFLQCIGAMPESYRSAFSPHELLAHSDIPEYPIFYHGSVKKALMEAWMCLARDVLVAPLPEDDEGRYFVTRKGQRQMSARSRDGAS
jgi:hypothetical protein